MQNIWRKMFIKRLLKDDDLLSKYIFRSKELRADGSVRPGNLKPREGEKLSLSEVTNLEHIEICSHGKKNVDNPKKRRVHIGYCKFIHKSFVKLELKTVYDNKPPRHVSVEFPKDPEQRRELAKALARECIKISSGSEKKYFSPCD